jgi:DNA-binding NarL/FixJ family response regulator
VVVADDAALVRAGIVRLLADQGFEVVAEADDHDSLLAAVERTRPDLVVTDIRMPPGQHDEGLRAAAHIRTSQPDTAVLVLSQYIEASAAASLLDGQPSGIGYLLKERVSDLDEFVDVARRIAQGESVIDPLVTQQLLGRARDRDSVAQLTDREREVLDLMAQGLSNHAIASSLFLSAKTVESHVRSIFGKLGLPDDAAGNRRVQAVVRWLDAAR